MQVIFWFLITLVIILQGIVQMDHIGFHFGVLRSFQTVPTWEVPQFLSAESGFAPTSLCVASCSLLLFISWASEYWQASNNDWELNSPPAQLREHYQRHRIKTIQHLRGAQPALSEQGDHPHKSSGIVWTRAFLTLSTAMGWSLNRSHAQFTVTSIFSFRNRATHCKQLGENHTVHFKWNYNFKITLYTL